MRLRRTPEVLWLAAAVVLVPTVAYANAGTPLMWAGMLHLVIGNLIIGVGEGLLVAKVWKARVSRAIPLMIGANYFSAWLGLLGLSIFSNALTPADIYDGRIILIAALAVSFVLTVALEWPFTAAILRGQPGLVKRSLKASLLAQTVSYAVLVPWYVLASGLTLYTGAHLERSLAFVKDRDAWVYYVSRGGDAVERARLDGSQGEEVVKLEPLEYPDRLFVKKPEGSPKYDLYLLYQDHSSSNEKLLLRQFAENAAVSPRVASGSREPDTFFNFGEAVDLRPKDERQWEVNTGFWSVEGITLTNRETGGGIWLSLETPFLSWRARNATVLPGDEVVFQLGDQIVIFDRPTRKIGLIARGRGPVVVLGERPGDPPQTERP